MKVILNWRYYIIVILFGVGFLAIGRAFGEPIRPMTDIQWLLQMVISLIIGVVSFFALYVCIVYWEHKGQISEFTNLKNE